MDLTERLKEKYFQLNSQVRLKCVMNTFKPRDSERSETQRRPEVKSGPVEMKREHGLLAEMLGK